MKIIKKWFNRYVYEHTEKPEHYVHVDEPKTLQDYRQLQYNEWCKQRGVYNGSYLPKDCNKLLKKGWDETTSIKNKGANKEFTRKSNGQRVRCDLENEEQILHYHWYNPNISKRNNMKLKYLDRYGKPCTDRDDAHHLAPLDEDCPKRASKKFVKNRKDTK